MPEASNPASAISTLRSITVRRSAAIKACEAVAEDGADGDDTDTASIGCDPSDRDSADWDDATE